MPRAMHDTKGAVPRIVLASASPRRRELLGQLGLDHEVMVSPIVERPEPGESPEGYVARVARDKARATYARCRAAGRHADWVLGADTEVLLDGEVLGKPADAGQACAMLRRLAGRSHRVLSAIHLIAAGRAYDALDESRVTLAPLDERDITAYVASGEPYDKAGGYAIQGRAAGFITRLEGSYSGVMGLPLHVLSGLLAQAGAAGEPEHE